MEPWILLIGFGLTPAVYVIFLWITSKNAKKIHELRYHISYVFHGIDEVGNLSLAEAKHESEIGIITAARPGKPHLYANPGIPAETLTLYGTYEFKKIDGVPSAHSVSIDSLSGQIGTLAAVNKAFEERRLK